MPRVLTEADVADFRERLCQVAERLFAEHGMEAVTMRQLAAELGVSPMTPYRYFRDKGEILAAVRASGFDQFAEVMERARAAPGSNRAKGAAVGEAYMDFAFAHPHTYKLMFAFHAPDEAAHPNLVRAAARARSTMSAWVRHLVAEGVLSGDPEQLGAMFWSAAHGAVVLEMAGMLPPGQARELHLAMNSALARGLRFAD
jgi:AcrR family transcriptional regulator